MQHPPARRPGRAAVARVPRWALVAVLTLSLSSLLASCRVDATVGVDVDADGSGTVVVTVELDRASTAELGPVDGVVLADLADAGWTVAEPDDAEGGLVLSARRTFASPAQLDDVLAEVGGGDDGVFRDVELDVDPSVDRTSYRFAARVVLTGEPTQFSDAELAAALGDLPLGRTPEELAVLGADDPDAATLVLRVTLPGGVPDTDGAVVDGAAEWRFPMTGGAATDESVTTSSQDVDTRTTVLLAVAAGLGVLALLALVVGLVRRRRRR